MQGDTHRLDHLVNWILIERNEQDVNSLMGFVLHYVNAEGTGSGTVIFGYFVGTIIAMSSAICVMPLRSWVLHSSLTHVENLFLVSHIILRIYKYRYYVLVSP